MKTLIIIAFALLPTAAPALTSLELQLCASRGDIAEFVMEAHQNGVPMSQQIAVVVGDGTRDPRLVDALLAVLTRAYDEPEYFTEQMRLGAIRRFRDAAERDCLHEMLGN